MNLIERIQQGMTTVDDAWTVQMLIEALYLGDEFSTDGATLLEYAAHERAAQGRRRDSRPTETEGSARARGAEGG